MANKEPDLTTLGSAPADPVLNILCTVTVSAMDFTAFAVDEQKTRSVPLTEVGAQTYSITPNRIGFGRKFGAGSYVTAIATRNFPDDGRWTAWSSCEPNFNATVSATNARYLWAVHQSSGILTNSAGLFFNPKNDRFVFESNLSGNTTTVSSVAQTFAKNALLSLGITKDPSNYRLYVDDQAPVVASQANFPFIATATTLHLGARNATSLWQGFIHEMHIHQGIWSSSDFVALTTRKRMSQLSRGTRFLATFDGPGPAKAAGDHVATIAHQLRPGDVFELAMETFTAERRRGSAVTDATPSLQGRPLQLFPGRNGWRISLADGDATVYIQHHDRFL